jgi:hypothetical protein
VACALNEDSADCSNLIVFTFSAAIQRSGTIEYTWHPDGRLPARGVQEETASTTSPYWRVQRSGARDIRREPLTVTRSPTESNVNVHKRALLAVIGLAGDVGAGPPTGVPRRHVMVVPVTGGRDPPGAPRDHPQDRHQTRRPAPGRRAGPARALGLPPHPCRFARKP